MLISCFASNCACETYFLASTVNYRFDHILLLYFPFPSAQTPSNFRALQANDDLTI